MDLANLAALIAQLLLLATNREFHNRYKSIKFRVEQIIILDARQFDLHAVLDGNGYLSKCFPSAQMKSHMDQSAARR
jgi:hypothetical protein